MNTIYKVHVTKKKEEEVQYMNQKQGFSYLRQAKMYTVHKILLQAVNLRI